MDLRVSDKTVCFAKHQIAVTLTDAEKATFNWCYDAGVYAETDQEKTDVEAQLTTWSKSFTTTDISPSQAETDKKTEIDGTVLSRSEALAAMP